MNVRMSLMLVVTLTLISEGRLALAEPPLIELTIDGQTLRGTSLAHDRDRCWLIQPDGQLELINLTRVSQFGKTGRSFRPLSTVDARNALRREYDAPFETVARGNYVVVAAAGEAEAYAERFDNVYREFWSYFRRRSFNLVPPRYPLVAIVLPDRKQFEDYCRRDGVRTDPTLQGYYHPRTNRVALYETPPRLTSVPPEGAAHELGAPAVGADDTAHYAAISGDVALTLIHEATHQIAFNTGLHNRMGNNPRWIVEGLAMMFETTVGRGRQPTIANPTRLKRFRQMLEEERTIPLADFVADCEPAFRGNALDAYAQAWAVTYYLSETRRADYTRYLKAIASNDPLAESTPETRLAEFRHSFGEDVSWLEVQMQRFYTRYSD